MYCQQPNQTRAELATITPTPTPNKSKEVGGAKREQASVFYSMLPGWHHIGGIASFYFTLALATSHLRWLLYTCHVHLEALDHHLLPFPRTDCFRAPSCPEGPISGPNGQTSSADHPNSQWAFIWWISSQMFLKVEFVPRFFIYMCICFSHRWKLRTLTSWALYSQPEWMENSFLTKGRDQFPMSCGACVISL